MLKKEFKEIYEKIESLMSEALKNSAHPYRIFSLATVDERMPSLRTVVLRDFSLEDKLIIGICNGCQILINLGLVPSLNKKDPEVALIENKSGSYECRWVDVKVNNNKSPWLKNISILNLPVAHQEGQFMIPINLLKSIKANNLIGLQYINNHKKLAKGQFPFNPNGSKDDIAALTNQNGNVLAMMPHPERAFYHYHVPNWQNNTSKKFGDGYKIFMNAKKFFA